MPPYFRKVGATMIGAALFIIAGRASAQPSEDHEHPPHVRPRGEVPQEVHNPGPSVFAAATWIGNAQAGIWIDTVKYNEWLDAVAENHRRLAALRDVSQPSPVSGGGGNYGGGGDCYARAPEGFPPHVIDRESSGDPNATNGGHDGCAQIADEHFEGGACEGMSYDDCWARLWDGGAGASNWSETL
jgi:hypothetical protein